MNRTITLLALASLTACGSVSTLGEVITGPENNTAIAIRDEEVVARNAALNSAYDHCRGYEVLNMETNHTGDGTEPDDDSDYEVIITFSCPDSSVDSD